MIAIPGGDTDQMHTAVDTRSMPLAGAAIRLICGRVRSLLALRIAERVIWGPKQGPHNTRMSVLMR
ncbi:MAG: hypothetical protein CFE44_09290 [Burkholderiales bacterium PBB4]|nr:MAG: hypothetical protein CFE44_09290 [Burkholderiales bacterium PBB4]